MSNKVKVVEVETKGQAGNTTQLEKGRLSPSTGALITAPVATERRSMFLLSSEPVSKESCEASLKGLLRKDREHRRDHGKNVAAPIVRWLAEYLNFAPTTAELDKVWRTEDDEPHSPTTYTRFTQSGLDDLNAKRAIENQKPLDLDDPFHRENPGVSPSKQWWTLYLNLAKYERKIRKVDPWNPKTETPVTSVTINGVEYGSPVEALESGLVTVTGAHQAWKTATALIRIEDMADYISGDAQYTAAREAAYWKEGDSVKSSFQMVVRVKDKNKIERRKRLPVLIGGEAASGAIVGIMEGLAAMGGSFTKRQYGRIIKALEATFEGTPPEQPEAPIAAPAAATTEASIPTIAS